MRKSLVLLPTELLPMINIQLCTWDVTVVDTLAPAHLHRSASEAGSAALEAEEKKTEKYSDIAERYNFCPIGMETMGS